MKNKAYSIRVSTVDNLYSDYIVEAENLFYAKILARNSFFRDYPEADENVKLSLSNPDEKNIHEIIDIIKEAE
jgi:hypothetical protein